MLPECRNGIELVDVSYVLSVTALFASVENDWVDSFEMTISVYANGVTASQKQATIGRITKTILMELTRLVAGISVLTVRYVSMIMEEMAIDRGTENSSRDIVAIQNPLSIPAIVLIRNTE